MQFLDKPAHNPNVANTMSGLSLVAYIAFQGVRRCLRAGSDERLLAPQIEVGDLLTFDDPIVEI